MSAHQLWLWLHEAMQGIPAWPLSGVGRGSGNGRTIDFVAGTWHDFSLDVAGDEHADCFVKFVGYLGGVGLRAEADSAQPPEAALVLLGRARAAWNGQVYGDERDDEIEAKRMKEGG